MLENVCWMNIDGYYEILIEQSENFSDGNKHKKLMENNKGR